ncbi:hypothetical protein ACJMK2_022678 [Sinanodonta woodiana]|uniref:Uncharacterized protein n=1 Tax=Sinanodonta woodiana TaxID=1069815 RepID=A0ABD3TKL6_SINWO
MATGTPHPIGDHHDASPFPHGSGTNEIRLNLCFEVEIQGNKLYAYHRRGVQLIDFNQNDTAPNEIEVLAALETYWINIEQVAELQHSGLKNMMLYPVDEDKPLIKCNTITIKEKIAHIFAAQPFERELGPRMADVHCYGLTKQIGKIEIVWKILKRFEVTPKGQKEGILYDYSNVVTGVRILRIKQEDSKRIPALFYVMGFRLRSWYYECEKYRVCSRCKKVGHGPWAYTEKEQPREQQNRSTYADVAARRIQDLEE